MVAHVLAAVTPTAGAVPVLARAGAMARAHDARLSVLHVLEASTPFGLRSARDEAARARLAARCREEIEAALAAAGVSEPAEIVIEAGLAPAMIAAAVRRLDAGLLVTGLNEGRGLRERIVGSTTDRLLRTAGVPMLVVRRPADVPYASAILATDFSDAARAAAVAIVALWPGIAVQLVHVTGLHANYEQSLLETGAGSQAIDAIRREVGARARARLEAFRDATPVLAARAPRLRVQFGDPAATLVRLSAEPGVNLVAFGNSGRGAVHAALLGRVAQAVLRGAACDVLVVPEPAGTRG